MFVVVVVSHSTYFPRGGGVRAKTFCLFGRRRGRTGYGRLDVAQQKRIDIEKGEKWVKPFNLY